jgi:hypothetical protein
LIKEAFMVKARKVEKLIVVTPNEVGILASITDALSSSGINIYHLGAYVKEEKGYFIVVTDNNQKASALLKDMGYEVSASDTLEIEFVNKPGTLAPVAKRLADNGIDIQYIFGTSSDGQKVIGLVTTNDDDKAFELINA